MVVAPDCSSCCRGTICCRVVMWNNVDLCFSENMTRKIASRRHCLYIIVVTIFCLISPCTSIISDKRLCYDPDCSVAIALAKTLSNYHSNDPHILSFHVNDDVEIFSKGAGSRKDLWGVEIAGKRGYAPSMFLIEKKTIHKNLEYEVPTPEYRYLLSELSPDIREEGDTVVDESGIADGASKSEVELSIESSIETPLQSIPQEVSPSFEVIDGTTLNLSPKEQYKNNDNYATEIIPGSPLITDQPILTVHPNSVSTEIKLQKNMTDETMVFPSGVSDHLPIQSAIPRMAAEKFTMETTTSAESSHLSMIEEITDSIMDEATTMNVKTHVPPETDENVETTSEDIIQDQRTVQMEELKMENRDIITSNIMNLPTNRVDENVETKNEAASSILLQKNELAEEPIHAAQLKQPPTVMEEKDEQINTEIISNSMSDPATDIIAKAFDTVTALFDGLTMTTEMPMLPPATDESTHAPTSESSEFVKVQIDITNKNNEETCMNHAPNDQVPLEVTCPDSAPDVTATVDGDIYHKIGHMRADTPEDIEQNISDKMSTIDGQSDILQSDESLGSISNVTSDYHSKFDELPANRNLLNVKNSLPEDNIIDAVEISRDGEYIATFASENIVAIDTITTSTAIPETFSEDPHSHIAINESSNVTINVEQVLETVPSNVCYQDATCTNDGAAEELAEKIEDESEIPIDEEDRKITHSLDNSQNYWETFSYLALTALTTLLFSLGYYYIENSRRDGHLIAKINKLEKELLISSKECIVLDESLKSAKTKLNSIEDQSFGSNEMVVSLKTELETTYKAKLELEDQVMALEKDLESATEAGLELERMLREILASNNAENPLAKSVEDLQVRLNAQQSANESLSNALHQKKQESEALSNELSTSMAKNKQLEIEVTRINDELTFMIETRNNIEQSLSHKVEQLENQVEKLSAERIALRKQLKGREMEVNDLLEVVKQINTSGIDSEKLSDALRLKVDANQLLEEKEELQSRLGELEGAHHLLEEHMKIINEEMKSLSNQCEIAEKEKRDAETRLQVLSKYFKEKDEERQKEEALWLQQQGEVSISAGRLQTVNNEMQIYKQQIETLKREILDQEREYKNQITNLESKSHEQWVLARQSERRLEEAKAEAGQLRNRLTLIEKNLSDNETDVKTHRSETNGETATSPQLFIGAEASSSPIMFTGSSNMPPPYPYGPPLLPFLPSHLHASSNMQVGYDVGQRPPPLGGRLSSPPPMPIASGGPPPPPPALLASSGARYEHSRSSPSPPLSPSILPPYGGHFRSHPPPPLPFSHERVHPPLPPPIHLPTMLPPHLSSTSWGDEKISSRNNSSFHPFHRIQQTRDYKGSLVSSEESLDKAHNSGRV